jgi:hypothetical protein
MITGARADDAAAFLFVTHPRGKIQPATNLERSCGVVVLVFHPRRTTNPFVEQRVLQQR